MKKMISLLISTAFLCTFPLSAKETPSPSPEESPKQVGQAAEEGSRSGRSWAQYTIAGVAIAVAVVALILVAKHKGSSSSSSSSSH